MPKKKKFVKVSTKIYLEANKKPVFISRDLSQHLIQIPWLIGGVDIYF